MIQVLDRGLVMWRSSGARIRLHRPTAVNTSPVTDPQSLLDVRWNAEGVRHQSNFSTEWHPVVARPSLAFSCLLIVVALSIGCDSNSTAPTAAVSPVSST